MLKLLMALKRDERGISALEYAVLAGVLLVVIVTGVVAFGDNIDTLFGAASDAITEATTAAEGGGD